MYTLRMPEAHFDLGRMDIYVHLLARQIQEEQRHGKHIRRQNIAVRFVNGVQQQPIAHQPAVDKNVDAVAVRPLHFRPRNEPAHRQLPRASAVIELRFCDRGANWARNGRDLDHLLERLPPKKLINAFGQRGHRRNVHDFLRGRLQRELPLGIRQRVVRHERGHVPQFRGV